MSRPIEQILRHGARAAMPAVVLSALPSTLHALLTRRDPLEASRAAGSILLPRERKYLPLLIAAVPVHLSVSAIWAIVLAASLPRKNPVAEGIAAGMVIAAVDLGIIARHFPQVRALTVPPQVADHVAFGIVASIALARQERQTSWPIRARALRLRV